ncbi:unnamed protein product [Discosporangium mesarthrocarpum]
MAPAAPTLAPGRSETAVGMPGVAGPALGAGGGPVLADQVPPRVRRREVQLKGLDTYCRPFGRRFMVAMNKSSMITALSFLDNDDVYNACLVSKTWVRLAMDDALWEDRSAAVRG